MAEANAPRKASRATAKSRVPLAAANAAARTPQDIRRQIEEAAYYRAEQRGFAPGFELEDWIAAESEVMKRKRAR